MELTPAPQPTPAEIARTLVRGQLPATAHVAWWPEPLVVRHATDCAGRPLLLCRDSEPLATALRGRATTGASARLGTAPAGAAVVLTAEDRPPTDGAPSLGRVWVSGWAAPPTGATQLREAALEFAETHADDDLLDLGRGTQLHRVEVQAVRLETEGAIITIDPQDYTAADPDPLYDLEAHLLADLNDHHVAELSRYLTSRLIAAGVPPHGEAPRPVRIDRYGLVVSAGRIVRLPFPRALRDRADLAELLHPVLFPHAHGSSGGSHNHLPLRYRSTWRNEV
jgi:hypothetical protein